MFVSIEAQLAKSGINKAGNETRLYQWEPVFIARSPVSDYL